MDLQKLVPAILVAYLLLLGTEYLIHQVWLFPTYAQYPDSWRHADQMQRKMWIMWVGGLLFAAMFAFIYTRGVEEKPWAAQGIRYGILIALLAVIPSVLAEYVVFRVPYMLAIQWMAAGTVQVVLMGLIVAFFCKKPAA